jgi:hypothetical protein
LSSSFNSAIGTTCTVFKRSRWGPVMGSENRAAATRYSCQWTAFALKRDGVGSNRHRALVYCSGMIPQVEPEGMLFGKPLHTFPRRALI